MITVAHFMCAYINQLARQRNNLRSGVKPSARQVVVHVLVENRSSLGSAGWRCAGRGRGLLVRHDHLAVRGVRHWRTGRPETYGPSYDKGDVRPYYVRPSLVYQLPRTRMEHVDNMTAALVPLDPSVGVMSYTAPIQTVFLL